MIKLHRIRRHASAGLALLFSAALAVTFGHQATEIHGYCSEHGEQIHLDHSAHEHAGRARSELHHEPEHSQGVHNCSILLFLAQGHETACGPSMDMPATSDTPSGRGHHLVAPAPISLLSLSPKTSPPRG